MLRRRHLGRISFAEANDFQRALLQSSDDYVLVFEHPPTYTRGIRTQEEHFLVPPESLNAVVIDADRGGDVTYHAPGQVVAWAIVTVDDDPSAGKLHVTRLEDAVIATVRHFDPEGRLGRVDRLDGYPGVWADVDGVPSKIAAVGVRTERNDKGLRRTLHGVALNVDIDMEG
ncbi:MAG TPA: lipoyl(octanoyl) transferase LipB, partial [Acidimicrobiales bacterium]|nr:lipoyl(octanoyl) transferase LipB [Acidimicrobiales bacterium]